MAAASDNQSLALAFSFSLSVALSTAQKITEKLVHQWRKLLLFLI